MIFLYSKWLSVPIETRVKIAKQFNIPKTGATWVENNVIKSDGYEIKDIEEKLNVDALQKFLVTDETDMAKLFDMLISCIENPIPPLPNPVIPPEFIIVPREEIKEVKEIKKHYGRPKGSKNKVYDKR